MKQPNIKTGVLSGCGMFWPWLCLALLVAGCLEQQGGTRRTTNTPQRDTTLEAAAVQYVTDIRDGMATAATNVAARSKSGELTDLVAVNDAWVAATADVHEKAKLRLSQRMTAELTDADRSEKADGRRAAGMFEKLAKGFQR